MRVKALATSLLIAMSMLLSIELGTRAATNALHAEFDRCAVGDTFGKVKDQAVREWRVANLQLMLRLEVLAKPFTNVHSGCVMADRSGTMLTCAAKAPSSISRRAARRWGTHTTCSLVCAHRLQT